MSKSFEAIKSLNFTVEELENFAQYFKIIHHVPGRIRLRASLKLKELFGKADSVKLDSFFEEAKNLPMIKSFKINKLIGSLTIEYDDKTFDPTLWELWLNKNDTKLVYERLSSLIKAL
ncbi:HMA2 domain-containing protein [Campylobacter troglodytis]|uniref:HMA2 domain-containing protein n=1 Tax=Campylobacter troglodytis TaxID=654363 RepID=UPI00115826D6|nr:hypothetical protein [Campylobacter troglodytis]TQR60361.1 hypothetical protein DMC01_06035 [Campylobacter troglodytis]